MIEISNGASWSQTADHPATRSATRVAAQLTINEPRWGFAREHSRTADVIELPIDHIELPGIDQDALDEYNWEAVVSGWDAQGLDQIGGDHLVWQLNVIAFRTADQKMCRVMHDESVSTEEEYGWGSEPGAMSELIFGGRNSGCWIDSKFGAEGYLCIGPYRNYRLDSLHWHASLWPNFDATISKLRWTLKLRIGYELREGPMWQDHWHTEVHDCVDQSMPGQEGRDILMHTLIDVALSPARR